MEANFLVVVISVLFVCCDLEGGKAFTLNGWWLFYQREILLLSLSSLHIPSLNTPVFTIHPCTMSETYLHFVCRLSFFLFTPISTEDYNSKKDISNLKCSCCFCNQNWNIPQQSSCGLCNWLPDPPSPSLHSQIECYSFSFFSISGGSAVPTRCWEVLLRIVLIAPL